MRLLMLFVITKKIKRLTEGAHQTSDDLIFANAAYFWHASLWRTTVHSRIWCQICLLLAECG